MFLSQPSAESVSHVCVLHVDGGQCLPMCTQHGGPCPATPGQKHTSSAGFCGDTGGHVVFQVPLTINTIENWREKKPTLLEDISLTLFKCLIYVQHFF